MSELNPIDASIVRLLESSRRASEQETTERARALHEASRVQDISLEIGGLLAAKCTDLATAVFTREAYFVNEANWYQKRRMRQSGHFSPPLIKHANGVEQPLTASEERLIRLINMRSTRQFKVSGLLSTQAELTDVGPIKQEWQVVSKRRFEVFTALRTINVARNEIIETTPVHRILNLGDTAQVSEFGNPIDEEQYFLPLGIVMEAHKSVLLSVPRRISKGW